MEGQRGDARDEGDRVARRQGFQAGAGGEFGDGEAVRGVVQDGPVSGQIFGIRRLRGVVLEVDVGHAPGAQALDHPGQQGAVFAQRGVAGFDEAGGAPHPRPGVLAYVARREGFRYDVLFLRGGEGEAGRGSDDERRGVFQEFADADDGRVLLRQLRQEAQVIRPFLARGSAQTQPRELGVFRQALVAAEAVFHDVVSRRPLAQQAEVPVGVHRGVHLKFGGEFVQHLDGEAGVGDQISSPVLGQVVAAVRAVEVAVDGGEGVVLRAPETAPGAEEEDGGGVDPAVAHEGNGELFLQ